MNELVSQLTVGQLATIIGATLGVLLWVLILGGVITDFIIRIFDCLMWTIGKLFDHLAKNDAIKRDNSDEK